MHLRDLGFVDGEVRRDGATAVEGRGGVDVTGTVGVVAAVDGRGGVDVTVAFFFFFFKLFLCS